MNPDLHEDQHVDRSEPEAPPTTIQKVAAEVFGTLILVFFGVGAALMSGLAGGGLGGSGYVTTGLAFGLAVLVAVAAVGRISGGHFNPAVTLGAALGGRLAWRDTPLYFIAQLFGGLLAGALLFGLMHGFDGFSAEGSMGQNSFGDEGSGYAWWAALLLELLLTAIFVWVILAVTDSRNSSLAALAPVAIGLMLALIHFASMSATGTSVNPARSIGVGVFAGTDAIFQLWLFILAPLLGGALAGLTYPLVFGQGAPPVPGSGIARAPRPEQPAFPPYGQPGPGTPWGGVAGQPVPGPGQPGQPGQPWGGQGAAWGAGADETQARPGMPGWGAVPPPAPQQPYQPQTAPTQQPTQQQYQPYQPQTAPPQQPHPGQQPYQQPYPGQQPYDAGQQEPSDSGFRFFGPDDDDEDGQTQVRPGG